MNQLATAIELAAQWLAQQEGISLKTIGQVVKTFSDQLTNLVYDVWNKHSDAIDFRRAFKTLLRDDAPQAYTEGLREGGIDEPDAEDQQVMDETVNDWLATQVSFVNDFAQAVFDARKNKDQRPAILDRVTIWVDSLRSIGERGRAYAMGNVKADWQLGDRQTHTQDCIDLSKLKPHRVSWWTERGYIPGNERHIGCGCRLRNVATGETIMGE